MIEPENITVSEIAIFLRHRDQSSVRARNMTV
jgi:hypothetical protein